MRKSVGAPSIDFFNCNLFHTLNLVFPCFILLILQQQAQEKLRKWHFKRTPSPLGWAFSGWEPGAVAVPHLASRRKAVLLTSRLSASTTRLRWTDGQGNNSCSSSEPKSKLSLSVPQWRKCAECPSQHNQQCKHFSGYKLTYTITLVPSSSTLTLLSINWDLCWVTQGNQQGLCCKDVPQRATSPPSTKSSSKENVLKNRRNFLCPEERS